VKRFGILLSILLLSITWQMRTTTVQGSREASPIVELMPHSALAQSFANGWVIVDFSSYSGAFTSIAIDSNDLVHISHVHEGALMYTRQYRIGDEVWWATYTVPTGAVEVMETSLTLDENDRPYIAYYDQTNQNLSWAWWPEGGNWSVETRNTVGEIDGRRLSAVVRGGGLHVAYSNVSSSSVEYIEITPGGGGWPPTPQTVATSVDAVADVSLALRSDDLPRISFHTDDGRLMYARYNGSAWSLDALDGSVEHPMGACSSLALTADNRARIAYYDGTGEAQVLRQISYLLLGWGAPGVVDDDLGSICYTSLAIDDQGYSRILYYDGHQSPGDYDGSLRYAQQRNGSGWSFETVDGPTNSCGMHSALALDSEGRPHASYYCGHLKYAYRAFTVYLPAVMRGQ